ncbi:MAG: hypothetical protein Q7R77_02045 [Candidatus Daviesbacteria bacterium]|nr:hypothetical protein [Candidatus Daviesbacteria bacterium]
MNFTYVIILVAVLIISPFVLRLASKQGKDIKRNLRYLFILMLSAQIFLGFLSGLNLGIFLVITAAQIVLLILNRKFYTLVVILNFINTVVFFYSMIRLGQTTGIQDTSFTSIGTAFIVLIENVVGLILINKDKNLLKKYT